MPETIAYPYIPNSVPSIKEAMLREIGVERADDLYAAVPERLRFGRPLDIPAARTSEAELRRYLQSMLAKNESCAGTLSFLGGGCWQHEVPAVCDEIANRGEFVTAYYGETYTDHGKLQALFEYASMLGELVELDAVSMPTYDWASAAATAICMAARINGRATALVPASTSPERLAVIETYCKPWVAVERIPFDSETGLLDLDGLRSALSADTACVYVENPGYLGSIETRVAEIADLAHGAGALAVVGVDPISLGVLEAPPRYGADIVCGDLQPLGIHMHFGGGLAGFIATPDTEEYVSQLPTFLIGLEPTSEGEYGFGEVTWERTSYVPPRRVARVRGHDAVPLGDRRRRLPRPHGADGNGRGRAGHHAALAVRGGAPRRAPGSALPEARRALVQGVRRRSECDREDGRRGEPGAPRGGHLRGP